VPGRERQLMAPHIRPRLTSTVRVRVDPSRQGALLLQSEHSALGETAVQVLRLCTGARRVEEIIALLVARHPDGRRATVARDVHECLDRLAARGVLTTAS